MNRSRRKRSSDIGSSPNARASVTWMPRRGAAATGSSRGRLQVEAAGRPPTGARKVTAKHQTLLCWGAETAPMSQPLADESAARRRRYNRLLLLVAGLGGLLYGVDVGIIASALPYLQATSGLNAEQLSIVVAAVLLGATISTLFAGWLADWMGRRALMIATGAIFVVSIPMISLAHGYGPLVLGRLCQGVSAGLIGVVVPLYLAESLPAATRGKGTAMFQWLLTLGIVAAAAVGMYFSYRVDEVAKLGDAQRLFAFKDLAWRSIFWVSLPPGILFLAGGFLLAESPRWLARRRGVEAARTALRRSRDEAEAAAEMEEIEAAMAAESAQRGRAKESLLKRKYVFPFVLACVKIGRASCRERV